VLGHRVPVFQITVVTPIKNGLPEGWRGREKALPARGWLYSSERIVIM